MGVFKAELKRKLINTKFSKKGDPDE